MIFAAVLVLTAGFASGIGYIWGSRNATDNILTEFEKAIL
jgi:hypothetical protein